MATFDLPELPETRVTPHLMLGAASPLWSYYTAAAAGGVAYWCMTRWMQPMNLEALFGALAQPGRAAATTAMPLVEAMAEPAVEAMEMIAEAAETVAEAAADAMAEALPAAPVGGEAAPISPLTTLDPDAAPVVAEVASDPAVEIAPGPAAAPSPEPVAMIEATADPIPEPVAKPRVRKTSSANGEG